MPVGVSNAVACGDNPIANFCLKIVISEQLIDTEFETVSDKTNLKRLEELQLLDNNKQNTLYDLIDTYIRDAKTREAYA